MGRIDEAGDVREASRQLATLRPDVLLLDIQMPGGSGFDVLALSEHMPPAVVFVTAFDHHALQAFEARAIDYLTKPIEPGRFAVAMARARQAVAARGQSERIAELQETVSALRHALAGQAPRREDFWVKRRDEFIRIAMGDVIRFQSAISQIVTEQQLIPFAVPEGDEAAGVETEGGTGVYEYEPEEGEILADLLPRNMAVQVYRSLLESNAGEQGARMTAMDNATRNAGDMIGRLTLVYNRTRQAQITKELIEIISGAEAL